MGVAVDLGSQEWGECLVPLSSVPPELRTEARRAIGAVPGWLPRIAAVPWLVRAMCKIIRRPLAYAPQELADLVGLVVSQDNSCRYCYGMQRTVLRIHGYPQDRIDRLVRDFHVADLSPAERAALDFARRISRASPLPGRAEFEAVVHAGLERRAVVEVAAVAASYTFSNRLATLLVLPPEPLEAFVKRPLFRFVRPLLAWQMRHRRSAPEPLPTPNDGPCARLVAALEGSPTAGLLRSILDDAWASDILPRRTKMLILAVVARAVGCDYGEREARGWLEREGFGPSDLDAVLTNLASPRLDPREARLVPFARETVRYQPAVIQQRVREVCRGFDTPETVEALAVIALANAVCRLSILLDAC